ncbi:MAG: hypothetical protein JWO89_766 [Verrucomicrobiaceae bacterium]|nr:hypothetical protein [Verrucomicrobiaceae bacterium]
MPSQKDFWNSTSTVSSYRRSAQLYPPEIRLLGLLRDRWPSLEMLDIGVGAGRTTAYFAELAKRYVANDFAANMVAQASQRFAGRWPHASFQQGDATRLDGIADASFDLVLFSYNGIDCVDFDARRLALSEMKRVCRPGGWVVFSSHNFYTIPRHLRFQFHPHPRRLLEEASRHRTMRGANPPSEQLLKQDQALFVDGTAADLRYAYVKPDLQEQTLKQMGFNEVRLYSCLNGDEITGTRAYENEDMSWVYYFCAV